MLTKTQPREFSEGPIPLLSFEGTTFDCGVMLGHAWMDSLKLDAAGYAPASRPWWSHRRIAPLVERFAPHLPELYRGMAEGSGVPVEQVDIRAPAAPEDGCTAFALAPEVTLDGGPISGQTKDTHAARQMQFQVLRLRLSDAPSMLTLTYPGILFGHGFVAGRCALFRNSLYAGSGTGLLPFFAWGLLALHCPSVEDVVELTERHGVREAGHAVVADSQGGIVGVEIGHGGTGILRPRGGIYTHANAVVSGGQLQQHEQPPGNMREDSLLREGRLRERFEADRGQLTAQLAYIAFGDHTHAPSSICKHGKDMRTTSAVVVEPAAGLLHATRGAPCRNWPITYRL